MRLIIPLILLSGAAQGATLGINMQNTFFGSTNPFRDNTNGPLANGDLVQVGYFELGSAPAMDGDSFDGFVPISTSLGLPLGLSVGDNGEFSATVELDNALDVSTGSLTLQYALRFFDASSTAAATFFNTVTNSDWQFTFTATNPPPPNSEMLLDPVLGGGTVASSIWEGGAASAFGTTVPAEPIPEPSTALSALLGLGLLIGARRRK